MYMSALGVLCCFALFVCLTLLASFFHLSFKNMYSVHVYGDTCTCLYLYLKSVPIHVIVHVHITLAFVHVYTCKCTCVSILHVN